MIFVGIDDTDTLDDPGTNQLARHLVRELHETVRGRLITRHQLLEDPRVPCTRKNGCAAIEFEPRGSASLSELGERIRRLMLAWCPQGSDPGLCIAPAPIPQAVIDYGRACQSRLVSQGEARQLAASHGIYLEGLGGTQDGVIGALAAVGLINTRDDGRVIFLGSSAVDHFDIGGVREVDELLRCGVEEIRCQSDHALVTAGSVDLGKRLRPNYRGGKVVLYVSRVEWQPCEWLAQRVV
jgi:tRNA(Ile2) C34 agmatinyltransferase TiaS